jgi:hypothetical protein
VKLGICVENKNPYSPACHVSINLQVPATGICVENKNPYSPGRGIWILIFYRYPCGWDLKIYTYMYMTGR